MKYLARNAEAAAAHRRALDLAQHVPQPRFLEKRLTELEPSPYKETL